MLRPDIEPVKRKHYRSLSIETRCCEGVEGLLALVCGRFHGLTLGLAALPDGPGKGQVVDTTG